MDVQTTWWWSSHSPLILAAVETFHPTFILELGSGQYSTPVFDVAAVPVWSIENDAQWLTRTKQSVSRTTKITFIHHDLGPGIHITTKPFELSDSQREHIAEYYATLVTQVPESSRKLAFVDQFTAARTLSINALLNHFEVIIYHDCEPEGIPWYEYYFDDTKTCAYDHYTFKTPKVWTGIFVKQGFDFNGFELCRLCKLYSDDYAKRNGLDPTAFFLQRGF